MDLVRASPVPQGVTARGPEGCPTTVIVHPGEHSNPGPEEAVYVETAEDLANVTVAPVGVGPGGAPLHLTTITVAVPGALSPSDVLQQHVVTTAPHQVALPTVPAPQETAVRWKYEQNKQEKNVAQTGSSLVSVIHGVFQGI